MPSFRTSAPKPKRPPIGLTALADVVFLLLVFFMLASSFLEWRAIDLKLPAETEAAGAFGEPPIVVSIADDGALRLDGAPVAGADLGARLLERLAGDAGHPVVVLAADEVPLQRTIEVLEAVSAAGGRDVSLAREGRAVP